MQVAEIIDHSLPAPGAGPGERGGTRGATLLYYPFWFLTYRIDHKEHAGVVNAVTGHPVGPSSPPDRWAPAWIPAAAGFASFLLVYLAVSGLTRLPLVGAVLAALASAATASVILGALLRRERGR
jgi:hypothetical protein